MNGTPSIKPNRGGQFRDQVRDARWYRKNIPVRLAFIMTALQESSERIWPGQGYTREEAEIVAVRILKWQEGPVAKSYFGMGMLTKEDNATLHQAPTKA